MKKTVFTILVLSLCLVLMSCSFSFGKPEHTHTWRAATCTAPMTCTECGATQGEPTSHDYGQWVTDLQPEKAQPGQQHHVCNICGHFEKAQIPPTGSLGLEYEINDDGQSCTVTGLGVCEDTEVVIPAEIDGYRVTAIGVYAFKGCEELTHIHIPETVTHIQAGAFAFCCGLTEITLPDSVVTLENSVFTGCENLQSVTLSQNITGVLNGVFSECTKLQQVNIPAGVTGLENACFRSCESLQSIQIPEGVTFIAIDCFRLCKSLTEVTLPTTVQEIRYCSFGVCRELTRIVYNGTTAQWNGFYREDGWDTDTGSYTVVCTDGQVQKAG